MGRKATVIPSGGRPNDKEISDFIKAQRGLSDAQKAILIEKSQQTWFMQNVKQSKTHLRNLTKVVKKQIKQYYNKKGEREDKRGVEHVPPKKGTNKKEMEKKVKTENIPKEVKKKGIVITKKQNKPEVPKEIRAKITKEKRKEYRKAYNQRPNVKKANRIRKANKRKMG